MPVIDNRPAIARARRLLETPSEEGSLWAVLGAMTLAATASMLLAGAIVLGPGFELQPPEAASDAP